MDPAVRKSASISVFAQRVNELRKSLCSKRLDGFLVPLADEHQGEYIPECAQRLRWLTGFSGSAGLAIVLARKAAVFTDGRYSLQVRKQVDPAIFETHDSAGSSPEKWLEKHLKAGMKLGIDPWLHTPRQRKGLARACASAGATLKPVRANLVDEIWPDRPPPPLGAIDLHPLKYAGTGARDKIARIAGTLRAAGCAAAVLTLPDSICWLLNIRGHDLPHNPVVLSFAIVPAKGRVQFFVDRRKLTDTVRRALRPLAIIKPPAGLPAALDALGAKKRTVLVDPARSAFFIAHRLRKAGATVKHGADPCLLPKAVKSAAEIRGARAAHRRDGVAVSRFLCWLEEAARGGALTEIAAAQKLEAFRAETGRLLDLSFNTISGAGPNGAIVHYAATGKTDRALKPGTLYLVDSGGQYRDGTTDITRTLAIGPPTAAMRKHFTLVLKGHIALAMARFPEGTTGAQLDALARAPLWREGLDYDHGTGHGVGSYLCVHEGPQGISKRASDTALAPGMIVSNEPGYYRAGHYGIRIENLVLVRKSAVSQKKGPRMLEFETLTLAPIARALVDPGLLEASETGWLNDYHARVFKTVGGHLDTGERAWLENATRPL